MTRTGIQQCWRGFTLIELLIVVAIIAILAAIAVPNFLDAQVRSKVSRVRADIRSVKVAMESYTVDYNGYPPGRAYSSLVPPSQRPSESISGVDLRLLTTPIAYMTTLPIDAFLTTSQITANNNNRNFRIWAGNRGTQLTNFYGTFPRDSWMAYSIGPDLDYNSGGYVEKERVENMEKCGPPSTPLLGGVRIGTRYDPSNGTVSVGDIYEFSQNAEKDPFAAQRPCGI